MRIDKLTVRNFKGFEHKTFDFPTNFTVVIGNNAMGKTSVLDSLAIAAGSFLLGIDGTESKHIGREQVRTVWKDGVPNPKPQLPVEIQAFGSVNEVTGLGWKRVLSGVKGRTSYKDAYSISNLAIQMLKESRSSERDPVFPVIAYHGTGRLWAEHHEKIGYKKQDEGVLMGYKDCLSPKSSSKAFLSWYKTYFSDAKNTGDTAAQELLLTFNKTISDLVPEWNGMSFHYGLDELVGTFTDRSGRQGKMLFSHLSDGYRNMIGMAADVAYRCIKLNGHLGTQAVLDTPGIVLIDELDLHLHPSWQRDIVKRLKTCFPKIQFVCTTHSPFIVQSLRADELINLDNQVLASDPMNRSLEENALYMGAESSRSLNFIEKVNDALRFDELLTLAKPSADNLSELSAILERNADDPALVARLKIKKLSKLGLDETS